MPINVRFSGSSRPPTPGEGGGRGAARRPDARTIALAVAALGVGALLLAFGLMLLATVAAVGTIGGAVVVLYHRLTGRWPKFVHVSRLGTIQRDNGLDPTQEVFPESAEPRRELPPPEKID